MICLTFDTDHLDEQRMAAFMQSVDIPGVSTFFCTQRYKSLEASEHELCPHPYLAKNDWGEELAQKRKLFPHSVGWRSHSCIFSHLLAEWVGENGYCYVSTYDQFLVEGIKPYKMAWGVWQIPIFYMDNMDLSWTSYWSSEKHEPFNKEIINNAIKGNGLYVFDFHPIHMMINTRNMAHYFQSRKAFVSGEDLVKIYHEGYGVYDFYNELCTAMKKNNCKSVSLNTALTEHKSLML